MFFAPVNVTASNYIDLLNDMVEQAGGSGAHGYAAQRARKLQNTTKIHLDAGIVQLMVHQADAMVVDVARRDEWTQDDLMLWNNSGNGFEFATIMLNDSPQVARAAGLLQLSEHDMRYASDTYRNAHGLTA